MDVSDPDLLFRCCSDFNVGRSQSGKLMQRSPTPVLSWKKLLLEFEAHIQHWKEIPTALVSTTTNILRVVHLLFHKVSSGENANQIEIIFITSGLRESTKYHCAEDLAIQLQWSAGRSEMNASSNGKFRNILWFTASPQKH